MLDERIRACHERARDTLGAAEAQIEHGLKLHRDLFICDLFSFTPRVTTALEIEHQNALIEAGADSEELGEASEDGKSVAVAHDPVARAQFLRMIEAAGLDCLVTTVGVGPRMRRGLRNVARFTYLCDNVPGLRKAVTAGDIRAAHAAGERSLVASANSTPALGAYADGYDMLRWIETYHLLGIRMMHLTYNRRNWLGDGCTEPSDVGLSFFGREVVAKLNELGIIVDTPHSGRQTTLDAAKYSNAPMAASHTGCEAVHMHPRCKSDEEIKAIAETGGVMGVVLIPYFLDTPEKTSIHALLRHIDHAVRLVGPDHVMIGSDATMSAADPEGVERLPGPRGRKKWWSIWGPNDLPGDPKKEGTEGSLAWVNWPWFTVGLVTLGYSDDDIAKIVGGNFLRLLADVQRAASPRFRVEG